MLAIFEELQRDILEAALRMRLYIVHAENQEDNLPSIPSDHPYTGGKKTVEKRKIKRRGKPKAK